MINHEPIYVVAAGVADSADISKPIKSHTIIRSELLQLTDLKMLRARIHLSEAFYPTTLDPRTAATLFRRMASVGDDDKTSAIEIVGDSRSFAESGRIMSVSKGQFIWSKVFRR